VGLLSQSCEQTLPALFLLHYPRVGDIHMDQYG